MKIDEILNLKLEDDDFDNDFTIGDYLRELLSKLWIEQERFNSKRPFGNSGWNFDIVVPLIKAGIVPGKLDEDGYIEKVDVTKIDVVVLSIIKEVFERRT